MLAVGVALADGLAESVGVAADVSTGRHTGPVTGTDGRCGLSYSWNLVGTITSTMWSTRPSPSVTAPLNIFATSRTSGSVAAWPTTVVVSTWRSALP